MRLPAGLEDQNLEIYVLDFGTKKEKIKATYRGKTQLYTDLPEDIRECFRAELIKDKKAIKALELKNIADPISQELHFVKCRFGGMDYNPDLNPKTKELIPDRPKCELQGKCDMEGILCQQLQTSSGDVISPRELTVLKYTALGLQDCEIADKMGISINTAITYQKRLREKIGKNNRIELMKFAMLHGLT